MPRPSGARRDEGEYRQYSTEKQRSQAKCSAGRMQLDFHHGLLEPAGRYGTVLSNIPEPLPILSNGPSGLEDIDTSAGSAGLNV